MPPVAVVVRHKGGRDVLIQTRGGFPALKAAEASRAFAVTMDSHIASRGATDIDGSGDGPLGFTNGSVTVGQGKYQVVYQFVYAVYVLVISPSPSNIFTSIRLLDEAVKVLIAVCKGPEVTADKVIRKYINFYISLDVLLGRWGGPVAMGSLGAAKGGSSDDAEQEAGGGPIHYRPNEEARQLGQALPTISFELPRSILAGPGQEAGGGASGGGDLGDLELLAAGGAEARSGSGAAEAEAWPSTSMGGAHGGWDSAWPADSGAPGGAGALDDGWGFGAQDAAAEDTAGGAIEEWGFGGFGRDAGDSPGVSGEGAAGFGQSETWGDGLEWGLDVDDALGGGGEAFDPFSHAHSPRASLQRMSTGDAGTEFTPLAITGDGVEWEAFGAGTGGGGDAAGGGGDGEEEGQILAVVETVLGTFEGAALVRTGLVGEVHLLPPYTPSGSRAQEDVPFRLTGTVFGRVDGVLLHPDHARVGDASRGVVVGRHPEGRGGAPLVLQEQPTHLLRYKVRAGMFQPPLRVRVTCVPLARPFQGAGHGNRPATAHHMLVVQLACSPALEEALDDLIVEALVPSSVPLPPVRVAPRARYAEAQRKIQWRLPPLSAAKQGMCRAVFESDEQAGRSVARAMKAAEVRVRFLCVGRTLTGVSVAPEGAGGGVTHECCFQGKLVAYPQKVRPRA